MLRSSCRHPAVVDPYMTQALLSTFAALAVVLTACTTGTATAPPVARQQAEKTALARVPGGTVKSAELEKEHGRQVWSFDIAQRGTTDLREVLVDAHTGAVLADDIETAEQEAAERDRADIALH